MTTREISIIRVPARSTHWQQERIALPPLRAKSPAVSCLMVTRGDMDKVRQAHALFDVQTWPDKELVVVSVSRNDELRAFLAEDARITFVQAPEGLVLGDLRNLSIAHASHALLCQWDEDDLYAPTRIEYCMAALRHAGSAAVVQARELLWWPARKRLAYTALGMWSNSLLIHRQYARIYPALGRGEDSTVVQWIHQQLPITLIDEPGLYGYTIHGTNTCDDAHFESLFAQASRTFDESDAREALALPCFNTIAHLRAGHAPAQGRSP